MPAIRTSSPIRPPPELHVQSLSFAAPQPAHAPMLKALEDVAQALGLQLHPVAVHRLTDFEGAFTAMRDLHAGITYINAPTIGAEVHLPFGGVKATGNGHREGGMGAIDFYTEWKAVYVDYSDRLQKAQIDRAD